MIRLQQVMLPLDHGEEDLLAAVRKRLRLPDLQAARIHVFQRAVDARQAGTVRFAYTVDVEVPKESAYLADPVRARKLQVRRRPDDSYHFLQEHRFKPGPRRPLVVGTGPCGLFAGLMLARMGLRPILLERGKMAGPRARDVTRFWRTGEFDPESNVQFGEGGAGTFSDGKLYTQIKDRENRCRFILQELSAHGAPESIMVDSRPHIGTDRLIKVLRHLRTTLVELGGEFAFEAKVTHLIVEDGAVRGVRLGDGRGFEADEVILAVGHSARDLFECLHADQIPMIAKPFSIGVRIEHPQRLINRSQFGRYAGHAKLGSAAYRFVHHGSNGRAVYSFCMCPGGLVVAAASERGQVVTNGMSTFARDEANANSGFMVEVHPEDMPGDDALAGVRFQRALEERAFAAGGGDYRAPAQCLGDFLRDHASRQPGEVAPSYRPGVTWGDLRDVLPGFVIASLKEAIPQVAKRLAGFDLRGAVMTAVESRSSSPLRILRDEELQCPTVRGLYPAGEGAGYAGGIISAAVDGMRVAEAIGRRHLR